MKVVIQNITKILEEDYKIDLVVCTSLGTFSNDDFLMRAAKNENIKTLSLMLSWIILQPEVIRDVNQIMYLPGLTQ